MLHALVVKCVFSLFTWHSHRSCINPALIPFFDPALNNNALGSLAITTEQMKPEETCQVRKPDIAHRHGTNHFLVPSLRPSGSTCYVMQLVLHTRMQRPEQMHRFSLPHLNLLKLRWLSVGVGYCKAHSGPFFWRRRWLSAAV